MSEVVSGGGQVRLSTHSCSDILNHGIVRASCVDLQTSAESYTSNHVHFRRTTTEHAFISPGYFIPHVRPLQRCPCGFSVNHRKAAYASLVSHYTSSSGPHSLQDKGWSEARSATIKAITPCDHPIRASIPGKHRAKISDQRLWLLPCHEMSTTLMIRHEHYRP